MKSYKEAKMEEINETIIEPFEEFVFDDELYHYGKPRRSGRYPYGSGKDPYQHDDHSGISRNFLGRIDNMRKQNFTYTDEHGKKYTGDTAIAKSLGLTTSEFRIELGIAAAEQRCYNVARAKSLAKDGLGATEIGKVMGINESSVRSLLKTESEEKMNKAKETANLLKKLADEKGMLDVSKGVENELGISKEKLAQSLYLLKREGYNVYAGGIPQVTNKKGQQTTQQVLCKPGIDHKEIYNYDKTTQQEGCSNTRREHALYIL